MKTSINFLVSSSLYLPIILPEIPIVNYEKKITSLKSFWISSSFFLVATLLSSILIIINTPLSWSFDADGFNGFLSTFSFPLKLIAGYLAVVGFISLNHRSEQTSRQISLTEENQKFTNYFKHREEFAVYCGEYQGKLQPPPISDVRKYHGQLFPNVRDGDFGFNQDVVESVYSEFLFLLSKIICYLDASSKKDIEAMRALHYKVFDSYRSQINWLIRYSATRVERDGYKFNPDSPLQDLIENHKILLLCFDHLRYLISFTDTIKLTTFTEFYQQADYVSLMLKNLLTVNEKSTNRSRFDLVRCYNTIFDLVVDSGMVPRPKFFQIPNLLAGKPIVDFRLSKYELNENTFS